MLARCLLVSLVLVGAASAQRVARRGRYIFVPVAVRDAPGVYGGGVATVLGPPRLDWRFAAPPGLAEALPKPGNGNFAAQAQDTYQLLLPPVPPGRSVGLVLHLSASSSPDDALAWGPVCRKHGLIFACPLGVGDTANGAARLRIAVAVLDDLRRRYAIDTDRIYLSGASAGAATAAQIAFSWPEACGGLLAIGGAASLRGEPYLRQRVRRRLSVACVVGALDPARHEVERYRFPVLRDADVKARLTVLPGLGKGLPAAVLLEQQLLWLESGRAARQALAKASPTLRLAEKAMPAPAEWSKGLLDEAKADLKAGRGVKDALMVLHGVAAGWPLLPAGRDAKKALDAHDRVSRIKWADLYNQRQTAHYGREANALDDFLKLMLAVRGGGRIAAGLKPVAIQMWEQAGQFAGPDTRLGRKAAARLKALKRLP